MHLEHHHHLLFASASHSYFAAHHCFCIILKVILCTFAQSPIFACWEPHFQLFVFLVPAHMSSLPAFHFASLYHLIMHTRQITCHDEHHHHLLFAFVLQVTKAYCTILSIIISSITCFLHQPLTLQLFVPVPQDKSAFILSTIIICFFYLFDKSCIYIIITHHAYGVLPL